MALINNLYQFRGYGSRRLLAEFLEINWNKRGFNSSLKKIRETESNGRRHGSSIPKHARTAENVTTVDELVGLLSQKDLTKGCILPVNSSVTRSTRDSQNFCDELTLRK